jgi:ribonuclease T2
LKSASSTLAKLSAVLAVVFSSTFALGANTPVEHFVLALSWSPTFCTSPDATREAMQCGRKRRYAFIVHGLWPQAGTNRPEYCPTEETWVPEEQIDELLTIMPSKRLIIRQWKKHGACSSLRMEQYFDLLQALFAQLRIPDAYRAPARPIIISPRTLVSDFIASNPGLDWDMIALVCAPGKKPAPLAEVRICYSPVGRFTQCSPQERTNCKAKTLVLPPVTLQ